MSGKIHNTQVQTPRQRQISVWSIQMHAMCGPVMLPAIEPSYASAAASVVAVALMRR